MASTSWQLATDSALRYEQVLVPAILGPAARAVVERAPVRTSRRIVDLGCGTGAAIRWASRFAPEAAELIGIDNNRAMLAVAREASSRSSRRPRYCAGSASALPLPDASCDLILCAQTLQFVDDHAAAAREMGRILAPGGTMAIGLWCPVEQNPYFSSLIEAVESHLGARTAAGLKAIFNLSDARAVAAILESAGFTDISVTAVDVKAKLPTDLGDFIPRHIGATPMAPAFADASHDARRSVVDHVVRQLRSGIGHAEDEAWFKTWVFVVRW